MAQLVTLNIHASKSVQSVVNALDSYVKGIERLAVELPGRLAEVGAEEARHGFTNAQYAGPDGDVTVTADTHPTSTGAVGIVSANGPKVAFIEFGTGIEMGQGYPGERPEGIAGLGEYGQHKGANPPWGFYGTEPGRLPPWGTFRFKNKNGDTVIITHGNPPAAGMAAAAAEMRNRLVPMAKGMLK